MGVGNAEEDFPFTESDCCGNGCVNCVLNSKPIKSQRDLANGKTNIIQNYTKFKLKSKKPYNESLSHVLELFFSCSDRIRTNDHVLVVPPGYHIMMRMPNQHLAERDGNLFILRPYSPFWTDLLKLEFKLLVDLNPNGLMTRIIESLDVEDEVEFRGPIGKFEHDVKTPKSFVIITQGIAITSAFRIIESILNDEEDLSRVYHLSCFTDLDHAYFRREIYEFNTFWNYRGYIYVSRQICDNLKCIELGHCIDSCDNWKKLLRYKEMVFPRRLDSEELNRILSHIDSKNEKKFIISGSRDFQNCITKIVKQMDEEILDENIHLL